MDPSVAFIIKNRGEIVKNWGKKALRLGQFCVVFWVSKAPSSSLVQDTALSRREQGFESLWGHQNLP